MRPHADSPERTLASKTLYGRRLISPKTIKVVLHIHCKPIANKSLERIRTVADKGASLRPIDASTDVPDGDAAIVSSSHVYIFAMIGSHR